MLEIFTRFAEQYGALKEGMALATGATEELLHVHFGLLIFVVVAVVLRRRMHSWWPVLTVLAFALLNEVIDYFGTDWPPLASLFDVINTTFWPLVLFLVARRRRAHPHLDEPQTGSDATTESEAKTESEDSPETP